jgi:hypothetical protein
MAVFALLTTVAWGQTMALPGLDEPAATETTPAPPDDPSVTPPPSAAATLPEAAKRSSLMVKRGQFELEWRVSYTHFSKSSIFVDGVAMLPVLVVGQVAVERVRRDILITALAARYGIINNLQMEVRAPYRYQNDRHAMPDASPPTETFAGNLGVGDLEGNIYTQLPQRRPDAMRWVVSAGVKLANAKDAFAIDPRTDTPLGTGFMNTHAGISGVLVSDPAALYWNANFTYNWARRNIRVITQDSTTGDDMVTYVDVKPGDAIDIGGGIAFALNPRLSLNTSATLSFSGATKSNGKKVTNTAITSGQLRFGTVWVNHRNRPVDISLSIGLSDDAPDYTVEWRNAWAWRK